MPMLDTDQINERHLAPISSRLWVIVVMDELVKRPVPQCEGEYLFRRSCEFRNSPNQFASTSTTSMFASEMFWNVT